MPKTRRAPSLASAVCLADFERLARPKMSRNSWEYLAGGAADEITIRWNREAFDRIALRPRVLVDVSQLDTRVTLFGDESAHPILLAPAACHRLWHARGEVETARGAGTAGATLVASTLATTTIEEMAAAATAPLWFQLYVQPDLGFTRELARRAEAAGCRALCVTVDTPSLGARNREERARFTLSRGMALANLRDAPGAANAGAHRPDAHARTGGGGSAQIYNAHLSATLCWDDLDRIRSWTKLPIVLKGVLDADDAERAAREGANGLIVSNHGGRNLDTVPATIDALPAIADRVAGRIPILVDGGVRRGTDVVKAIALGATAVLIGRPYLCGLALGGAAGVARVVEILRRELEMAMALSGRTRLAAIDRSILWGAPPGR